MNTNIEELEHIYTLIERLGKFSRNCNEHFSDEMCREIDKKLEEIKDFLKKAFDAIKENNKFDAYHWLDCIGITVLEIERIMDKLEKKYGINDISLGWRPLLNILQILKIDKYREDEERILKRIQH